MIKIKIAKKLVFLLQIVLLYILLLGNKATYAESTSGKIDKVILKTTNNSLVELDIDDYIEIYDTRKGRVYDFLKNENNSMYVVGIKSGEKYIYIDEYIENYDINLGNISKAITDSNSMESEQSDKVKHIKDYEIKINYIEIGDIEGLLEGDRIKVIVPKEIANLSIGSIQMNFSNEVKILEIDEQAPWLDIIDRFKQNGYSLNNYYDTYTIKSSWSYTKLVNIQPSTSYVIATKDGYKSKFFIDLIIE